MKRVLGALCVLVVLTLATTGIAFVDLGAANLMAALLIAAVKGSIIAMFFMRVGHSKILIKIFAVGTLFWLAVLVTLSFNDYISRAWIENPSIWP